MADTFPGVFARALLWGAAAVFTTSALIVGTFAAITGSVWMLLTGRNPLLVYRNYADMARRARNGQFGWGMPSANPAGQTQAAGDEQRAPRAAGKRRFGRAADVQDAVVKEIRS